jgi:DNA processing protein
MDEIPFFEPVIGNQNSKETLLSDEENLKSAGNIFNLLKYSRVNNYKARLLIEYFQNSAELKNAPSLLLEQVAKCGNIDFREFNYTPIPSYDDVSVVTYFDQEYPSGLKDLKDAPLLLWVRGEIPRARGISIVGTRNADEWGKKQTYEISRIAAESGLTVISGLALGIDTQAHIGCLDGHGITVAILACDVRFPTPKSNLLLAERILENSGCLIAEVPPGTQTEAGNLIARNRLQAAWSSALVVTQSGVPSGTLHTVRFALELNRKLVVLKPKDDSNKSEYAGNHQLINEINFDSRILNGSKEFQSKISNKKPCADVILQNSEDFLSFVKANK